MRCSHRPGCGPMAGPGAVGGAVLRQGKLENQIRKRWKLLAAQVSFEQMQADPVRLNPAGCADAPLPALRRRGRKGAAMEHARATTIGQRLWQIRGRIRMGARQVWRSIASDVSTRDLVPAGRGATGPLWRVQRAGQGGK